MSPYYTIRIEISRVSRRLEREAGVPVHEVRAAEWLEQHGFHRDASKDPAAWRCENLASLRALRCDEIFLANQVEVEAGVTYVHRLDPEDVAPPPTPTIE
jgi:hypothetical protein